jgi:hypothetical protein
MAVCPVTVTVYPAAVRAVLMLDMATVSLLSPFDCPKINMLDFGPIGCGGPPTALKRLYIPEEAGRGQVAGVSVFVAVPGRVWGMPGGGPGSRWSARLDVRP